MTTAPDIADSSPGLVVGTPTHFGWLNGIVKAVIAMNGIDAVLTLVWVRAGFATEANLFLREIVNNHAVLFVLGKLGLVSLGSALLWRMRKSPLAVVGIFIAFLAYYILLLYHLRFAGLLIGQLF